MNRFRYYYEVAKEILYEEDPAAVTAAPEPATTPSPEVAAEQPQDIPPDAGGDMPPEGGDAAAVPAIPNTQKKDIKDKVDETLLIKNPDEKSLIKLTEQIDNLSIKIIEKREKILTMIDAISFLNKIDDTKPDRYMNEEKIKKLNGLLTSKEYDNLSPSNLFAMHNALKENFKITQKDLKNKKDSKGIKELKETAKKAKRAKISKNINLLNKKIEQIKSNLANINQLFDFEKFPKISEPVKQEIKLAQENSSKFIKKLS
jgi:hypothetical protein